MGKTIGKLGFLLLSLAFITNCSKSDTGPSLDSSGQEKKVSLNNKYIVVFKDAAVNKMQSTLRGQSNGTKLELNSVVKSMAVDLVEKYQVPSARHVFSLAFSGVALQLSDEQRAAISADSNIAFIEPDHEIHVNQSLDTLIEETVGIFSLQTNPTWGIDRLDQNILPLDSRYTRPDTGTLAHAYVIDTGILIAHQDFSGRAVHGRDFVDDDNDTTDCNGHGTHVAGTVAGTTYGVTRQVKVHGVRVLNCQGSGNYSDVIAGIEWVVANRENPAVINMSLGGPVSQAVDNAVNAAVSAGVTVVVAAGNENQTACESSPARATSVIAVGSTTITDGRSSFSNYGACVDIFAPGTDILSTWYTSPTATNTISGTSMASPHVTGVVAMYLSKNPQSTPAEVRQALLAGAVSGRLTGIQTGSPNLLANTLYILNQDNGGGGDDGGGGVPPPPNEPPTLVNGQPVTSLSGAAKSERVYKINVPAGAANFKVNIQGSSGDADLYVKRGVLPTATIYDCRPYKYSSTEECSFTNPQAGDWYVAVRGFSDYSDVSLAATYSVVSSGPCSTCTAYRGSLLAKASADIPDANGFQATAGRQTIYLEGPAGTDFDLYLYVLRNGSWQLVASSAGSSSVEKIIYDAAAGTYLLRVRAYSGQGAFTVWK